MEWIRTDVRRVAAGRLSRDVLEEKARSVSERFCQELLGAAMLSKNMHLSESSLVRPHQ
jgi:hypothetical protein